MSLFEIAARIVAAALFGSIEVIPLKRAVAVLPVATALSVTLRLDL